MEYINNVGPIGKLMYKSNVASFRYLNYYFDEHLTDTQLGSNVHLMVNAKDSIPTTTTCLMINVKIPYERLHQIICESQIESVVFFKDVYVENIDTNAICRNIHTVVCYNAVSLNMINRCFPSAEYVYMFRQNETINGKRIQQLPAYTFERLKELHIYSSGSSFHLAADTLTHLSIYSAYNGGVIDVVKYPNLHSLRVDEKIRIENLHQGQRTWQVLQFYPSVSKWTSSSDAIIDLTGLKVNDMMLPPTKDYTYKLGTVSSILGAYVRDVSFFTNIMTIDIVGLQVFDNLYPLKMCNLRFSNTFYKYFPFPADLTVNLIEKFNIQKQRENLIMIFNFDFMRHFEDNTDWRTWYNICIETYHRIPLIVQNGQLMLTDGTDDANEKVWPNTVDKVRKECIIFVPEEELIYINCSPLRLQTLVDKITTYRQQKFIISKLWLVTNGFELNTKDIEERIENLTIVNNQVKMYLSF